MKKKIGIIILIIIIIIGIAFLIINNASNNESNKIENIAQNNEQSSNEENVLIAEVSAPETEEVWEWQYDTLENRNINASQINSVHNTIDSYPINAEVIVKDGVIVDEYYKDGYDKTSVFTLQSTSKSITSAIFGIAIDKGYIDSVEEPISNYFPQILNSDSQYKSQITI